MAKKLKFGVYFNDVLVDTIEAGSQEEAQEMAYDEIEKVPSQLKYKGKIIYEDDIASDEVDEMFDNEFSVKPM